MFLNSSSTPCSLCFLCQNRKDKDLQLVSGLLAESMLKNQFEHAQFEKPLTSWQASLQKAKM